MNSKVKLLAPIALILGGIGFGSLAIANLTNRGSNSTLAQNSGGMNHGGMNHGGMNHNMDIGPADANYDLRFIDSMIPHHQGALVMAQEVLQKSKRPELIKLAKGIITEQKKEIAQMQQWRKQWYPKASATPMMWHTAMNHEMAMTAEHKQSMMMSMSLGKADAGFDRRFLDAMIPHHQGAVTMGQDLLKKSKRPEMQKLARNIITSQQAEIAQMTQWQREWSASR
ncbi:DUF305 domain-containing protein [Chamaesiphon minutus]|uniref:DUF305 domain-containing protein n=1 Tax=Chamaesiphon minutus (strain ATCC 27169 / PCC 6605) TaxID=1173020 RepID=K9URI8_CHAP6|nr:DUF305 domain-containing protein [Chamaesiphon minutus]AFY96869.1 hypothetical protein Cha6605_6028 [Chamaesiphon minutus PCC 6605]